MQNSTAYQNINTCAEWAKRAFWENVRSINYKSKLELNKGYCFFDTTILTKLTPGKSQIKPNKRDKHGVTSVKSFSKHSVLSVSIWSRMGKRMRAFVGSKILGNNDITNHLTLKAFLEDTLKKEWLKSPEENRTYKKWLNSHRILIGSDMISVN